MSDETADTANVAIARIEATLKAIKNQIDYSERASAQLVKMIDERFSSRFDEITRRLDEQDRIRDSARTEAQAALAALGVRVTALETWKTGFTGRLIGIAIGIGVASGGAAGIVLKLLGAS